jgi:heme/copper-type cytochrome/quinol oxidase subunit 2
MPLKQTRKRFADGIQYLFYGILASAFILSMFFYQKVGGANIWEFLLPFGIVLSLLTASNLTVILEKRKRYIQVMLTIIIVIIVLPRWVISVSSYYSNEYQSTFHGIDRSEREALEFVRSSLPDNAVILNVEENEYTSYASVQKMLTGKQFYFAGEGVRQIETEEIRKRKSVAQIIQNGNYDVVMPDLKSADVTHLFYINNVSRNIPINSNMRIVFQNEHATILQLPSL